MGKKYRLLAEPFEIADFYAEYSVLSEEQRNHYLPEGLETQAADTRFQRRFKRLEDAEHHYIKMAQDSGKKNWWWNVVCCSCNLASEDAQKIWVRPRNLQLQSSVRFAQLERILADQHDTQASATPFSPPPCKLQQACHL